MLSKSPTYPLAGARTRKGVNNPPISPLKVVVSQESTDYGEGRVYVTNINGDIEAGDYITTSLVTGYGQKQDDDLLHSYTLGKATESVDWTAVTETVDFNGKTYKAYPIAVVYTSG